MSASSAASTASTDLGISEPKSQASKTATETTVDSEYTDSSGYISSEYLPNHTGYNMPPAAAYPAQSATGAPHEDGSYYAPDMFYQYGGMLISKKRCSFFMLML